MTKEIDQKLQRYHAQLKERGLNEETFQMEVDEQSPESRVPIAKVNLVSQGSPAFHAGSFWCGGIKSLLILLTYLTFF